MGQDGTGLESEGFSVEILRQTKIRKNQERRGSGNGSGRSIPPGETWRAKFRIVLYSRGRLHTYPIEPFRLETIQDVCEMKTCTTGNAEQGLLLSRRMNLDQLVKDLNIPAIIFLQ